MTASRAHSEEPTDAPSSAASSAEGEDDGGEGAEPASTENTRMWPNALDLARAFD